MFIDANASIGSWPFQVFPFQNVEGLLPHLRKNQIEQALVSHLGTAFYPIADHYNQVLFEQARNHPEIHPVPVLNLAVPGWEKHFDQYREEEKVKTVKILPAYHFYSLKDHPTSELVKRLLEHNLPLVLQLRLEDERNQYRGLTVKGLSPEEVIDFNNRFPDLKVLALNAYLPDAVEMAAATNDNLAFDISFTERSNTVDVLSNAIPPHRLFFGSHTPILYTMSATMKVQYCTQPEETKTAIASGNARAWFHL